MILSIPLTYFKMLGLFLDTLIIGHKCSSMFHILHELTLKKELQNVMTNNVFWAKSKITTTLCVLSIMFGSLHANTVFFSVDFQLALGPMDVIVINRKSAEPGKPTIAQDVVQADLDEVALKYILLIKTT